MKLYFMFLSNFISLLIDPSYAFQNIIFVWRSITFDHNWGIYFAFYHFNNDWQIDLHFQLWKWTLYNRSPELMDVHIFHNRPRNARRILARTVIAKLSLMLRFFLVDPSWDALFNGPAIGQFTRPYEGVQPHVSRPMILFPYSFFLIYAPFCWFEEKK